MKKLITTLLFAGPLIAFGATEEQLNKEFKVQPGDSLIVNVDFGSIDISTNATGTVTINVWRKIGRKNKDAEEKFLKDNPVVFSQDGTTVTIRATHPPRTGWSWWRGERNEAKYIITVPAKFNAQLTTSGGGISARDLTGRMKANTSGGPLKFERLHGPLEGETSGGGIDIIACEGTQKIHTSGGGIRVSGGSGSLDGNTSGGPVSVKNFHGATRVKSSGGGIMIENVIGEIKGSTSGGSVSATCPDLSTNTVDLSTSGGGVTMELPENAAFDLDAETSGGSVSSDLPVTVSGKIQHGRLKGTVNGGGPSVRLRSSGGNIRVNKRRH